MAGEKGDQEWVKMWGADVKVVNPGNLMPDDMLKSCITTTQKVSAGGDGQVFLQIPNNESNRESLFENRQVESKWNQFYIYILSINVWGNYI